MRKLRAGLFVSLEGVTEAPNIWQFAFDEEMGSSMAEVMTGTDLCLLGRVTYQDWNTYWPEHPEEPFGSFINNTPKLVVSTTLDEVTWGGYDNIELLRGNLAEEINDLKEQPGQAITLASSPTLVRSLLEANLIDELTLMIHPVVAGKGKRLFSGEMDLKHMELIACKGTSSGVIIATYRPYTG